MKASSQPSLEISNWTSGSMINCPIQTDAPIRLVATARWSSNQRTASACAGM